MSGEIRGEILCPGAVSKVILVALGVCWWRKGWWDGGPASPAPNVDLNLGPGAQRVVSETSGVRLGAPLRGNPIWNLCLEIVDVT